MDLESGKLKPHDPNDMFLGVADVAWSDQPEPTACQTWLDYITRVVPDNAERRMLQSFLGYSLTDWINDHFLMVIGGNGAGKSTLINAISKVMGSLACHFSADIMMKRLAFAAELQKGASLETATVNLLTGDDVITGNFMRQNDLTYRRTHKTILFGNHRPNFGDGITRRLALLAVKSIPEKEHDLGLTEKLAAPDVKSAILHWMVEGLALFIQDGRKLVLPASVKARNEEAFDHDDPLSEFLEELNVVNDSNAVLPASKVYNAFLYHCSRSGRKQISQRALTQKLIERGWPKPAPKRVAGQVVRAFEGKALAPSARGGLKLL
ncbi:MAG: phage/plasmid primase, P4 family [Rhodospirillaceae bacterium]|nr:phage/plasmid primase, P4 family [Rhodospirillaceae bacterium]